MRSVNQGPVIPVILCGGSGTRLWPYSREQYPKQFLKMLGDNSLLQETAERSKRITGVPDDQIVTVTLDDLRPAVATQLGATGKNTTQHILSEPLARNTAAAVAYAALYCDAKFGENAFIWALPADHHMKKEDNLRIALENSVKAAQEGYLVTFGIQPTRPETGYGYINTGDSLIEKSVFKAKAFYEKPDKETARSYIKEGTYLWNSGMFFFQIKTVLAEFEKHAPDILDGVRQAMKKGTPTLPDRDVYARVAAQPFDKAIMEKSDSVAVVPCDPEWSDIGSWESLWELKNQDENGNATEGRTLCHETKNCLVLSEGKRLIACAGVENLAIVETDDVLLITDRTDANHLKGLVNRLKEDNAPEIKSFRPKDGPETLPETA